MILRAFMSFATAGLVVAAAVVAQPAAPDKKPATAPAASGQPKTDKPAAAPPPLSPEAEAWMKAGEVGPMHKFLEQFVGDWDCEMKMTMPGAPPEESKGTAKAALAMEGRFIHVRFDGTAHGKAMAGVEICGYNNVTKEFEDVWHSSQGTGFIFSTGTCDAEGKNFTLKGKYTDAFTHKVVEQRIETKIVNKDKVVRQFFHDEPDGKAVKVMEITYTRTKPAEKKK